jgi:hypothetical protein
MTNTVQMSVGGLAATNPATLTLPAPSGAVVPVTNGVATVQPQDVPTALRAGWTIGANQPWPAVQVKHLSAPAGGNWPVNGTITFPDGTTAAVTNGAAVIPIAWFTLYTSYGWSPTPGTSAMDL